MEDIEKKLKIIHVLRKATYGGAQASVFDTLAEVKVRGYTPVLVFGKDGELQKRVTQLDIPTHQILSLADNFSFVPNIKVFLQLVRFFKKERPHIVHIHNTKFGLAIEAAARLSGCKKIFFTSHGWHHNEDGSLWRRIFFFAMEWLVILFSTKTIVVSETMYAQAPSFLIPNKLHIIKDTIEPFAGYGRDKSRELLGIQVQNDTVVFGMMGNLHKNKGVDVLIKAFKKLYSVTPHVQLYIIGDGKEKTNLQHMVSNEKLTDVIHFLGAIDNAKDYLKAFNVFVLPSRTEAFGYSLLEAGVAKVPCIATRVGGIPEVIEHRSSGLLVSKDDMQELFLAMLFTVENRKIMESYAQNLYATILKDHTKVNGLEKLCNIYSTPKNS